MTGNDEEPMHEGPGTLLDPETLLVRYADELAARFAGTFTKETVERCVFDSYRELAQSARIHTHLPALTVRFARDRLDAQARVVLDDPAAVPEVLFVCTHNAARSQLAAALLAHHSHGRVHVHSAGTAPAPEVNPTVVQVLREVGVEVGDEFPKPVTDDIVAAADIVVTMGCGDACPVQPGKRYLDWALDDPEGRSLARVRAIRDDIDARVRGLLAELAATPA